ncbi:MAG: TonB family protein, partial [Bacteroidota bacterium]
PPPPPKIETVRFVPPEPSEKDDEEPPPPQEKLVNENVSTVTQEGEEGEPPPPVEVVQEIEDNTVYTAVQIEEPASFPGGDKALLAWISKTVVYPQQDKENGVEGKVYVKFIVEKDGSVTGFEIQNPSPVRKNLEKEALRVMKLMPKWNPAKQGGKPARMYFVAPFNYKIN